MTAQRVLFTLYLVIFVLGIGYAITVGALGK